MAKPLPAVHWGLMVDPMPTDRNTTVFAEVVPSAPLIYWAGFSRSGWRRYWPLRTGRTFKEAHIRWWYEIHEIDPDDYGTHWYQNDGGAATLRHTITQATRSVTAVLTEIDKETKQAKQNGAKTSTRTDL